MLRSRKKREWRLGGRNRRQMFISASQVGLGRLLLAAAMRIPIEAVSLRGDVGTLQLTASPGSPPFLRFRAHSPSSTSSNHPSRDIQAPRHSRNQLSSALRNLKMQCFKLSWRRPRHARSPGLYGRAGGIMALPWVERHPARLWPSHCSSQQLFTIPPYLDIGVTVPYCNAKLKRHTDRFKRNVRNRIIQHVTMSPVEYLKRSARLL
jgi:hypothetical protein